MDIKTSLNTSYDNHFTFQSLHPFALLILFPQVLLAVVLVLFFHGVRFTQMLLSLDCTHLGLGFSLLISL